MSHRVLRRIVLAVAACYAVVVAAIVFWPVPVDRGRGAEVAAVIQWLRGIGLPDSFGYDHLEMAANVLLFVPFGALLAILLPRRAVWIAPLVAMATSIGVELAQAAFLNERYAAVSDVIANTTGAAIGWAIVWPVRAILDARAERIAGRRYRSAGRGATQATGPAGPTRPDPGRAPGDAP